MPEYGDERFYREKILLARTDAERKKWADRLADLLVSERRIDKARAERMARNDKPRAAGMKNAIKDSRSHKHSLKDAWKDTKKGVAGTTGGGLGVQGLDWLAGNPELVEQWVPDILKAGVFFVGSLGEVGWVIVFIGVMAYGIAYILRLLDKGKQAF
jgi:hypothetical protein